jgi:hypothetical protein
VENPDSEPENMASQPTIHVIPDTLDAWNRRDED